MNRDERFYAFIVSTTSRSRSYVRRITIHKRWVKASAVVVAFLFCAAAYGVYGLTQQALHLRIEEENNRLRIENERQRRQLQKLENRVDAIEDASRRIAETAGVSEENIPDGRGTGGPLLVMNESEIAAVEARAVLLEAQLHTYELALKEKSRIPSIFPVLGEMTDGFGGRRDPFGGSSYEFHPGQDIRAERGTPVVAAATGTVIFTGTQNGYGQMV
ncbi:MAG TPA: peptidoglycan DD-metalloendopeptidase family protein, partial [Pyrinomonadaceae bacterium]|nr:peptidoglycan DD-metalloendopeptidase family protein [Pyrinomonadaceae bacterium]